jgi:hypothetical protein
MSWDYSSFDEAFGKAGGFKVLLTVFEDTLEANAAASTAADDDTLYAVSSALNNVLFDDSCVGVLRQENTQNVQAALVNAIRDNHQRDEAVPWVIDACFCLRRIVQSTNLNSSKNQSPIWNTMHLVLQHFLCGSAPTTTTEQHAIKQQQLKARMCLQACKVVRELACTMPSLVIICKVLNTTVQHLERIDALTKARLGVSTSTTTDKLSHNLCDILIECCEIILTTLQTTWSSQDEPACQDASQVVCRVLGVAASLHNAEKLTTVTNANHYKLHLFDKVSESIQGVQRALIVKENCQRNSDLEVLVRASWAAEVLHEANKELVARIRDSLVSIQGVTGL